MSKVLTAADIRFSYSFSGSFRAFIQLKIELISFVLASIQPIHNPKLGVGVPFSISSLVNTGRGLNSS